MGLTKETCVPCRGGMPTLAPSEIAVLLLELPGWTVVEREGISRLEKAYAFDDFVGAMDFARRVGDVAEMEGHHPDLHVSWGRVVVETWTHKIKGLHKNDFVLAAKVDETHTAVVETREAKNGVIAVLGVDFFQYPTSDMTRTQTFWRDVIGLAPGEEFDEGWSEFDVRPSVICFTPDDEDNDESGTPCAALAVADIHAAIAALKKAGVEVLVEPKETSVCWMSYIADPDGNRICIHQRKDGTTG